MFLGRRGEVTWRCVGWERKGVWHVISTLFVNQVQGRNLYFYFTVSDRNSSAIGVITVRLWVKNTMIGVITDPVSLKHSDLSFSPSLPPPPLFSLNHNRVQFCTHASMLFSWKKHQKSQQLFFSLSHTNIWSFYRSVWASSLVTRWAGGPTSNHTKSAVTTRFYSVGILTSVWILNIVWSGRSLGFDPRVGLSLL